MSQSQGAGLDGMADVKWVVHFTTRCRKVPDKFRPGRRCILGNRAGSQDLIELGNRIRDRRNEISMSQEKVAEQAGISANTVSRIEGGQSAMSIEIFIKMVQILDVDANELLGVSSQSEEKDGQCQKMFCRIQHLKQNEQTVVLQTMEALVDGLWQCR